MEMEMNEGSFYRMADLYSRPGHKGRYPFSKSTLDLMIRRGEFPAAHVLGRGIRVWHRDVLDAWDAEQAAKQVEQAEQVKSLRNRRAQAEGSPA